MATQNPTMIWTLALIIGLKIMIVLIHNHSLRVQWLGLWMECLQWVVKTLKKYSKLGQINLNYAGKPTEKSMDTPNMCFHANLK